MVAAIYAIPIAVFSASQTAIYIYQRWERETKWAQAREYAERVGKPLLNIGSGFDPRFVGDINMDIRDPEEQLHPNYVQASIYAIPYPDKYFGAAFASHVLEHLDDPQAAIDEVSRVADRVYICVPMAISIADALYPGHKWIFTGMEMIPNSPAANLAMVGMVAGSILAVRYILKQGEIKL